MLCRVSAQALWFRTPGGLKGDSAQARGVGAGRDVTVCDGERELGPVGPWYRNPGERAALPQCLAPAGAVRGGQDQFSWEDVKTDKQRRTTWVRRRGPGARGLWVRRAPGCAEGLAFCSRRQPAGWPRWAAGRRDVTSLGTPRAGRTALGWSREQELAAVRQAEQEAPGGSAVSASGA